MKLKIMILYAHLTKSEFDLTERVMRAYFFLCTCILMFHNIVCATGVCCLTNACIYWRMKVSAGFLGVSRGIFWLEKVGILALSV